MTLLRLTLKNGFRSAHRYGNYVLASSFAVMIFYLFSAFILNPGIRHGYMTSTVINLLAASQFIVIVFAVFFIFFFHNGLLRLRSKEFGLFLTLGMTPKQIGRLILVESLLLGLIAIGVGMSLGILFSKLFLLILGEVLNLPNQLPFVIPIGSVQTTLLFFGLVFLAEALWVSWFTRRRSPRNLLLGPRVQQEPPKFSIWWVLIGVLCLIIGYDLAVQHSRNVVGNMFPILILTSVGTYLLFSQVLVMVLTRWRLRAHNAVTLLVISRLAYRLKDNARVLTVVTILTAVVLSGMGSVLGMEQIIGLNSMRVAPYSVMLATQQARPSNVSASQIRQVLGAHQLQISGETEAHVLTGQILSSSNQWMDVQMLSYSTFEQLRSQLVAEEPLLRPYLPPLTSVPSGHGELLVPYPLVTPRQLTPRQTKIRFGGRSVPLQIDGQSDIRIVNSTAIQTAPPASQSKAGAITQPTSLPDLELVISNENFAAWAKAAPASSNWSIHNFMLPDWQHSQAAVKQIASLAGSSQQQIISSTITSYEQTQQLLSVMLFAGFFISILFFLTAGGSIYFRLDAQREEDQKQFRVLQRLGVQRKEISQILTFELFLLFFVPVAVALLHSTMAIIDFTHLVPLTNHQWPILGSVVGIYCVLTLMYFWMAKIRYLRRVTDNQLS